MNTQVFSHLALKQLGKRYIFGHEVKMNDPSPKAFDCSELIQWLFHQAGVNISDGSGNQYKLSKPVVGALRIGDLFFLLNRKGVVHHVGVYVGNGQCVEAKGRLFGVVKSSVANINKRGGAWRRYGPLKLVPFTVYPPVKPATSPTVLASRYLVTASVLNVRSRPSTEAVITERLKRGFAVYAGANHGGWRRLCSPVGYVAARYLTKTDVS